jgi:SOS-response transcriptional repressor LexA
VDVYGIPFSLIPFKGKPKDKDDSGDDPIYHHIAAVPERDSFEIRIPMVEGYTYALRQSGIHCDVEKIETYLIDEDPTHVYLAVTRGVRDIHDTVPAEDFIKQDKALFYQEVRIQQVLFHIAQDIVRSLENGQDTSRFPQSRHQLFPEILAIVEKYVERRIELGEGVNILEIAARKHTLKVKELILAALEPAAAREDAPLIPLINRFKPFVSSSEVSYRTVRLVEELEKSHLNYAEIRSTDESIAIRNLENAPNIICFLPNSSNLGLRVPYEYSGNFHDYIPDFIIQFQSNEGESKNFLLLEIKGGGGEFRDPNQVKAKNQAAKKWCEAVNNLKRYGRWNFDICREIVRLPFILAVYTDKKQLREPWKVIEGDFQRPWDNCLPVVALKTAAGYWSREQINFENSPEWSHLWVEPQDHQGPWPKGTFIAQVQGDSMEPRVPNGAWCIFTPPKAGSREGKAVLVWHSGISDPHTGGQYTLKVYHSEKKQDEDTGWTHQRITLKPLNPAYQPIILEPREENEVRIIAELAGVIKP